MTPLLVPFCMTLAPISGSPVTSLTMPLMVRLSCAKAVPVKRNANNQLAIIKLFWKTLNVECHTVFSSWFSYYWKIIDLSYYKCYVLSADILARGMPNERQTILLRMNNVDNQLLIFYREKGKFGCLWCGDVEKIHSRYSTISLSFLEVLLSTLIGSLVHRRYALSLQ